MDVVSRPMLLDKPASLTGLMLLSYVGYAGDFIYQHEKGNHIRLFSAVFAIICNETIRLVYKTTIVQFVP